MRPTRQNAWRSTTRAGDRLSRGPRRGVAVRQLYTSHARAASRTCTPALGVVTFERAAVPDSAHGRRAALARLVPCSWRLVLVFSIVHVIPGDPAVIAAGLEASRKRWSNPPRPRARPPLPVQFATLRVPRTPGDLDVSSARCAGGHEIPAGCRSPPSCAGSVRWRLSSGRGRRGLGRRHTAGDTWMLSAKLVAVPRRLLAGLMLMLLFSVRSGCCHHRRVLAATTAAVPDPGAQSAGAVARMTRSVGARRAEQDTCARHGPRAIGPARARCAWAGQHAGPRHHLVGLRSAACLRARCSWRAYSPCPDWAG